MKTASKIKGVIFSLILLVAGVGLLAGMIGIAVSLGRAEIRLQREAGVVEGSMRWTLAGVPVFSRSLDGLAKVERDDYRTRDESSRRTGPQPTKQIGRLQFVDVNGAELAWAERVEILNEQEKIERFLAPDAAGGVAKEYAFQERPGTLRERAKAFFIGIVTIPMLGLGGMLGVLAGVLSLRNRVRTWNGPRPVQTRRTQKFEHRVPATYRLPQGRRFARASFERKEVG